jgi:hypothetical protein
MQLGMLHREDGPAIEEENGTNIWYFNNKPHRAAGPACEYTNGTKEWYFHGNLHREDGPAVIMRGGYKAWHKHGLQHRVGGPAVEWSNGVKEYWENDKLLYTQCKGIVYNPKVKIVGPCTSLMSMDLKTNKIVIHKNKC